MKITFRKIFTILIIALIMMLVIPLNVFSTSENVWIQTNDYEYSVGNTITMEIYANCIFYRLTIYDTANLEFLGVIGEDCSYNNQSSTIDILFSKGVTCCTLQFKAIKASQSGVHVQIYPSDGSHPVSRSQSILIKENENNQNNTSFDLSKVTLSASKDTYDVNENINVTASGIDEMIKASTNDFTLKYDNSKLDFVSTTAEYYNIISDGEIHITSINKLQYSFVFKAKESGTTQLEMNFKINKENQQFGYRKTVDINILEKLIVNDNLKTEKNEENVRIISGFQGSNTTVNDLSKNFNNNYIVKAYNRNGTELPKNKKIGTGTIIKINEKENGVIEEYQVVIYGDTNGDGEISAIDALSVIKNKLSSSKFSDKIYEQAGRVTENSRDYKKIPNSMDALAIIKHKLGIKEITQK